MQYTKLMEDELVSKCRKNNRTAQNQLFKLYEKRILGICLRYASTLDEARDLQQEVFIKVFRNLVEEKVAIQSIEMWIVRITVNTAIDYYRKKRSLSDFVNYENSSIQVEPSALARLHEEELIELIQKIPHPYRLVFNLFIIDGYNHSEIGTMLGLNESTSRSYLTRAKDLLRDLLTKGAYKQEGYERYVR